MFDIDLATQNILAIVNDWQASPSLAAYHPEIIDENWTKAFAIERLQKDNVKTNNGKTDRNLSK